ncbi:hypothetical protein [Neobacillus bataviensis]|uniref:hypothetical protein n=1 Tax=Neobacillus bataviensis TaxID=220685 RepID=UPI001CBDCC67|nr:hypothetical protein [Neobacillus bataviensis]
MYHNVFQPFLYKNLIATIENKAELDKHVKILSQLDRLSGEPEAEKAVDYIIDELNRYDVTHHRYQFDGYFSDPIFGEVIVNTKNSFYN